MQSCLPAALLVTKDLGKLASGRQAGEKGIRMTTTRKRRPKKERIELATKTMVVDNKGQTHISEYIQKAGREHGFFVDVLLVSFLVFLMAGVFFGFIFNEKSLGYAIAAAVLLAAATFFWRLRVYDHVPGEVIDNYTVEQPTGFAMPLPEDEAIDNTHLLVQIPTFRGVCEFYQPRYEEFATWIRKVLKDEANPDMKFQQQVTLSKNQALKRRNWPEDMYDDMIKELHAFQLVRVGRNSVPEPTNHGITVFRGWTSGKPPHPQ